MPTRAIKPKTKHPVRRIITRILAVFFILLIAGGVFIYINLGKLLTNALNKGFNANVISDVYELKFEKLSVNLLTGTVRVFNVKLQRLEKPLQDYPYINSSFRLGADKMMLKNVDLITLLRTNELKLKQIEFIEPGIDFKIADVVPVFFPFKDTTSGAVKKGKKKSIESYTLDRFDMIDASFHVTNTAREREFDIQKINISLVDMVIEQLSGMNIISYKNFIFSIGALTGSLQKKAIKQISFKDFNIRIDSLHIVNTPDTSIYRFADFAMGLKTLDIQTADSLFHLAVQSFSLSYRNKSIKMNDVAFKPNVSDAIIQSRYKYQHTHLAVTLGDLLLNNVSFDSLIYQQKLFIDELVLNDVTLSIFRDNTKPVDKNRVPLYLGQQIKAISLPIVIRQVKITGVNLVNTERKPDGMLAKANINRGTVTVSNLTNQPSAGMLEMTADAFIENRARTNLRLAFSYEAPQFNFRGRIAKFHLPNLNPLIQSYTPAKILKGTADEITFSGTVYRTWSTGTMQFLYHDLEVDLELKNKAKWKSSLLAFAANTAVNEANPVSEDRPARTVSYHADRNMNKGFVNILIKSLLSGLKETMIMSKENRKAYKKEKKKFKKQKR